MTENGKLQCGLGYILLFVHENPNDYINTTGVDTKTTNMLVVQI